MAQMHFGLSASPGTFTKWYYYSSLLCFDCQSVNPIVDGHNPTKRTFEMICLYFQGWASLKELIDHIEGLKSQDQKQQ